MLNTEITSLVPFLSRVPRFIVISKLVSGSQKDFLEVRTVIRVSLEPLQATSENAESQFVPHSSSSKPHYFCSQCSPPQHLNVANMIARNSVKRHNELRGYSALEFHFSCMYQQPWVQKDCLPRALYPRSQQSSEMGQLLVTSQTRLANKTVRQAVKRSTSVHPRQQRINLFKRCCSFCSGSLMRKKKKRKGQQRNKTKHPHCLQHRLPTSWMLDYRERETVPAAYRTRKGPEKKKKMKSRRCSLVPPITPTLAW